MEHLFKLPDNVGMTHGFIKEEVYDNLPMFNKEWLHPMEPIEVNEAAEAITLIKVFGDLASLIVQHQDVTISTELAQIIADGAATYQLAHTQMFLVKKQEG